MRADLHIHSTASDGYGTPEEIVRRAKAVDLDLIAVTDHDTMDAVIETMRYGVKHGVCVIPGCEVSSKHGHILALWIHTLPQRGRSAEDTIAEIHAQGGIAVAAHPFSCIPKGCGKRAGFDGIEVINASPTQMHSNYKAIRWWLANTPAFAAIANSDSHILQSIGTAMTVWDGDLRRAIESRRTSVEILPRHWFD